MAFWGEYVPVAQRRARARREMDKLRKKGKRIQPVEIDGRTIARSFWGTAWCKHLEGFSDYINRLPRGRTYARNGSVCHLAIHPGRIEAIVSGSELYHVDVRITSLKAARWKAIKTKSAGAIGSMLELLQGKLSDQVMAIVTDRQNGLFPLPGEISFDCDCPDWAGMCKHVAAVFYGVGHRLDSEPELLFTLRDVDAQELIAAEMALPATGELIGEAVLGAEQLGDIFGIDLDTGANVQPVPQPPKRPRQRAVATPQRQQARSSRSSATPVVPDAPSGPLPRLRPTGRSVARLRHQYGLSVPQFARRLGVSAASVYRWEASSGYLNLQERPLLALAVMHRERKQRNG